MVEPVGVYRYGWIVLLRQHFASKYLSLREQQAPFKYVVDMIKFYSRFSYFFVSRPVLVLSVVQKTEVRMSEYLAKF